MRRLILGKKMKEELKAIRDSIKKPLEGVGISAPGAVNVAQQQINGISAIPYIHGFNIFAELKRYFNCQSLLRMMPIVPEWQNFIKALGKILTRQHSS